MKNLFVLLSLMMFCFLASAQENKVLVSVSHSGDDSIGKRLAYSLREAVRSSKGYKLVGRSESGINIILVTIDPEKSPQSIGNWTAASVSIVMRNFLPYEKGNPQTWYPIYMTSSVMTVGSQRTEEQSKSIMASLDAALEDFRSDAVKSREFRTYAKETS